MAKKQKGKKKTKGPRVEKYFDLGDYSMKISTKHSRAQLWYNRGLRWCFGFNHEEAVRCFENALKFDSRCPMIYWGIGYASGSNYNNPTNLDSKAAYEASHKALQLSTERKITNIEQQIIKGLVPRYKWPHRDPNEDHQGWSNEMDQLRKTYVKSMSKAFENHPDNTDVAYLYIEALMCQNAWKLWETDESTGNKIRPETFLAKELLEKHLKIQPKHPGLGHLYIHMMELSPNPSAALTVADQFVEGGGIVPDSGHLIHMASHIDMWVGNYNRAVRANALAFKTDEKYVKISGCSGGVYLAYRMHNLHFLVWAAMFDGQSRMAIKHAREIQRQLTEQVLRESGMVQYLEAFTIQILMVFIRFGMWDRILAEKIPTDEETWATLMATTYYARGMAFAAKGEVEKAQAEYQRFKKMLNDSQVLGGRWLHNNKLADQTGEHVGILNVGEALLQGEILYRKGSYPAAWKMLSEAVKRDHALPYDEPWGWMQPTRHALGALLCEQKHFEKARQVFEEDLKMWPNNLWSLHGMAACEKRLGNENLACEFSKRYKVAAARMDVPMINACFCARGSGMEDGEGREIGCKESEKEEQDTKNEEDPGRMDNTDAACKGDEGNSGTSAVKADICVDDSSSSSSLRKVYIREEGRENSSSGDNAEEEANPSQLSLTDKKKEKENEESQ